MTVKAAKKVVLKPKKVSPVVKKQGANRAVEKKAVAPKDGSVQGSGKKKLGGKKSILGAGEELPTEKAVLGKRKVSRENALQETPGIGEKRKKTNVMGKKDGKEANAKPVKSLASKKGGSDAAGKAGGTAVRAVSGNDAETSGRKGSKTVEVDAASADFMPLDASMSPLKVASGSAKDRTLSRYHDDKPRVMYIGRIPHGFYEDEMAGFFGQFGTITRLRVSRNKKTGKSKHYGFMEFESPEVAAIVVECMHNYLLFGSVLQCKLVPQDKVHPTMWIGANRKFRAVPWKDIAKKMHNKERTAEEHQGVVTRLLKRERKRMNKLREAGIEYDFEGFRALVPKPPKHTKFGEE